MALKLVDVTGTDLERYAARFLREARVAASIRHRYIVEILDFGTTDLGQPYIVMEHLIGESLGERLYARWVPLPLLLRWFDQLLAALGAVHAKGVVHRDLKPDNVFLVNDLEGDFPKLLDFGVSRVIGTEDGRPVSPLSTHEGRVVGTPWYMSPEQARGRRDIDHRTDIYAVGTMLYEAVSGTLPFEADNLQDLMIKVASGKPTPIESLCPEVPEALRRVVRRAMARDREARFQDAEQMREGLKAGLEAVLLLPQPQSCRPRERPSLPTVGSDRPSMDTAERSAMPTLAAGTQTAESRAAEARTARAPNPAPVESAGPAPRGRRRVPFAVVTFMAICAGAATFVAGAPARSVRPDAQVSPPGVEPDPAGTAVAVASPAAVPALAADATPDAGPTSGADSEPAEALEPTNERGPTTRRRRARSTPPERVEEVEEVEEVGRNPPREALPRVLTELDF